MTNNRGCGGGGRGRGGGMGRGNGRGQGGGKGRGRGMGQGRGGTGQGMGRAQETMPSFDRVPFSESHDTPQEAQTLRALEKNMREQLRAINKRIAEFDGVGRVPSESTGERSDYSSEKKRDLTKATAILDRARCISCGLCVDMCPEDAITMNDTVVIDPNKCTGCGSCINECPNEAISLSGMAKRSAS